MIELVVVRHGRTEWNAGGRFQGHTDVPLDRVGRAQAKALAAHLQATPFDRVVASDLARARATAEAIVAGRGLTVETDARWREMSFGRWEGKTWEQIVAAEPHLAEKTRRLRSYEPPGGETFADLCARIAGALDELRAAPFPMRVLVATHAGPLHALLHAALGASAAAALKVRFDPASITRIRIEGEHAILAGLNETVS